MAAASDTQEPTMAKGGLQGVVGREKQNVVPQEGRDVPHASVNPLMTESTSDEHIRPDDKDPFDLQEDHNQWNGGPQTPAEISVKTEAYKITSLFRMLFKGQKIISPVKTKSSTSVENQGSPKSSESKKSVLVASERTNGKDKAKAIRSNDWFVRQEYSSPHAARPSISKNIYSEGTVVNDKKSNIKLKNKEEIHSGFFYEDCPNFKGVNCSGDYRHDSDAQYDPFGP